jgi:methyl-accepting chemotaxis protein
MTESKRMREVKRVADLIQEAVDEGATTVEEIHKAIADLPLKMLEEVEFLKKPVKEVRRIQDRSIGAVYDLIREINEQVRKVAADMLSRRRPPAEKRPVPAKR